MLSVHVHAAGAYTFQPTITKQYSTTNLLEDIKGLYKVAAFKGIPVVFIFRWCRNTKPPY